MQRRGEGLLPSLPRNELKAQLFAIQSLGLYAFRQNAERIKCKYLEFSNIQKFLATQ